VLFTKTYGRVLTPGLRMFDAQLPEEIAARSTLASAWRSWSARSDGFIEAGMIAA
jgi:hypothetical protein